MKLLIREIIIVLLSLIVINESVKLSAVKNKYHKGVKAYTDERWTECIAQFEESISLYRVYRKRIINCRLKCNRNQYNSEIQNNIEDLKIYELLLKKTVCLKQCIGSVADTHLQEEFQDIIPIMSARKPFEYLHVCYFQMNALPKAASAAYTFHFGHPDDITMLNNVKYYSQQPEVDVNEIEDLLIENFMIYYKNGKDAYNKNDWEKTITNFEEAIKDYFSVENNCRAECELQPDQQISSEFFITIANNIASLLHCQQQCQDILKKFSYQSGIEFLTDVLDYLQISYYYTKDYEGAAEAVSTYMVMIPDAEDMIENKKFYSSFVDKEAFVNRSDIVYYFKRDTYEKMILNLFHKDSDEGSFKIKDEL